MNDYTLPMIGIGLIVLANALQGWWG